jgi:hypothetical protein
MTKSVTNCRNKQTNEVKRGCKSKRKEKDQKNVGITPRLRLYFVAHHDDDGENYDLFVWSGTLDAVADHWRSHYELDDDEEQPDRIFEISIVVPRPGPVPWDRPGHVHCVFGDKRGPR